VNAAQRLFALALAGALLAACGGGGSTPAAPPATSTTAGAPSITSTSRGTVSLALRYPTNFHIAKPGKFKLKPTASTTRRPQYVNPGSSNLIFAMDNGNDYTNGGIALSNAVGSPDGTQLLTLGLPSGTYDDLNIQEWDSTDTYLLASGDAYNQEIFQGQDNSLSVTLTMNAVGIAFTTDLVNGSDAQALSTDSNNPTQIDICSNREIGVFAIDSQLGFVLPNTPSGYPGIPSVTLYGQSGSGPGTSYLAQQGFGYYISYDGSSDPFNAIFTAVNPYNNTPVYGYVYIYCD
jgi:hypothetical protein